MSLLKCFYVTHIWSDINTFATWFLCHFISIYVASIENDIKINFLCQFLKSDINIKSFMLVLKKSDIKTWFFMSLFQNPTQLFSFRAREFHFHDPSLFSLSVSLVLSLFVAHPQPRASLSLSSPRIAPTSAVASAAAAGSLSFFPPSSICPSINRTLWRCEMTYQLVQFADAICKPE